MFKTVLKYLYAAYSIIICVYFFALLLIGALEGLSESDVGSLDGMDQFGYLLGAIIGVGLVFPAFHAMVHFIRRQLNFMLRKPSS